MSSNIEQQQQPPAIVQEQLNSGTVQSEFKIPPITPY